MKVLMVNPDISPNPPMGRLPPTVPLGLALVGAAVKRAGHQVTFHNDYLERGGPELLRKRLGESKPNLIGCHVNLAMLTSAADLIRVAKDGSIPVVIGGPEVTLHREQTMSRTGATYAIVGEGEETMPELCAALESGGKEADLRQVRNLWYRRPSDGQAVFAGARPPMDNMDNIPFLPLDLFPLGRYYRGGPEIGVSPCDMLSTSRGCPFRCTFCANKAVWGSKYRFMSPKRVVDEVVHMKENWATRGIYFREDHFTLNRARVIEICHRLIDQKARISWVCESRVDSLDEEMVALMKQAGCRAVWFGVEAGTQRVLDMLRKQTRLEQVEQVFRLLRRHGIARGASVMLGIPGQTMEENRQTLRFLRKLDPDWVFFNDFVGLPGSEMYDYIESNNLVWAHWEGMVLPNSEVMTWPQKESFKRRSELLFNLRPRMLVRHARRLGLRAFLRKGVNVLSRYHAGMRFNRSRDKETGGAL